MNATQGFRCGLKKNARLPIGDPIVAQNIMQDKLEEENKIDDDKEYVDPAEEVGAAASAAIREAFEQGKIDLGDDTVVDPEISYEPKNTFVFKKTSFEPKRKEKGKKEDNISMRQFWRYRTYERDELKDDGKAIPHTFHWLWTMRKLSEYFIISVLNR